MAVRPSCEESGRAFDGDGTIVWISELTAGYIHGRERAVDAGGCRFGGHGSWVGALVRVIVIP